MDTPDQKRAQPTNVEPAAPPPSQRRQPSSDGVEADQQSAATSAHPTGPTGAPAVADSVADGVIPQDQAEDLVIVCGVFIHPGAEVDKKIYDYNYQATKDAIAAAMKGHPSVKEMLAGKDKAAHPFRGF